MTDNVKTSTLLNWAIIALVSMVSAAGGFVLNSISGDIENNGVRIDNLTEVVVAHGLDINWQEAMDSSLVVSKNELKQMIMRHTENGSIHAHP